MWRRLIVASIMASSMKRKVTSYVLFLLLSFGAFFAYSIIEARCHSTSKWNGIEFILSSSNSAMANTTRTWDFGETAHGTVLATAVLLRNVSPQHIAIRTIAGCGCVRVEPHISTIAANGSGRFDITYDSGVSLDDRLTVAEDVLFVIVDGNNRERSTVRLHIQGVVKPALAIVPKRLYWAIEDGEPPVAQIICKNVSGDELYVHWAGDLEQPGIRLTAEPNQFRVAAGSVQIVKLKLEGDLQSIPSSGIYQRTGVTFWSGKATSEKPRTVAAGLEIVRLQPVAVRPPIVCLTNADPQRQISLVMRSTADVPSISRISVDSSVPVISRRTNGGEFVLVKNGSVSTITHGIAYVKYDAGSHSGVLQVPIVVLP